MKNSQRGKASGAAVATSRHSNTQPMPAMIPAAMSTPLRSACSRRRAEARGVERVGTGVEPLAGLPAGLLGVLAGELVVDMRAIIAGCSALDNQGLLSLIRDTVLS